MAGSSSTKCIHCGANLLNLGAAAAAAKRPKTSMFDRLVDSAMYMTQGSVLYTLAGLAVLSVPMNWMGRSAPGFYGIFIVLMMLGFEIGTYFHIVKSTTYGFKELRPPSIRDVREDLWMPVVRYLFALAPMIASIVWYLSELPNAGRATSITQVALQPAVLINFNAPGVLFLISVLMWPLLTIIAAVGQSIPQMYNPVIWVQTLKLMKTDYLIGVLAFYVVAAFDAFILSWIRLQITMSFDVIFLTSFIVAFITYLPMALRGRILGAICEPYADA